MKTLVIAALLFLLFAVGVIITAAIQASFGHVGARRGLRLLWLHRRNVKLYDDVWRRPDGVCVNDEGTELDKNWNPKL